MEKGIVKKGLERIKRETQELRKEFRVRVLGYVAAGFGLVAGLAWNDAIRSSIEFIYPSQSDSLAAKFIYAFIITLVLVALTTYLVRLFERKSSK